MKAAATAMVPRSEAQTAFREAAKRAINARGLTQLEVAPLMGRSQGTLSRYLDGTMPIQDEAALRLGEVLGLEREARAFIESYPDALVRACRSRRWPSAVIGHVQRNRQFRRKVARIEATDPERAYDECIAQLERLDAGTRAGLRG